MSLFWRVAAPFIAGYYVSYVYRMVNAVLAPTLAAEFGLSAGGLLLWSWTQTSFAALGTLLLVMAVFFIPCYPLGTSMAFRHLADPARQFASVRVWARSGRRFMTAPPPARRASRR